MEKQRYLTEHIIQDLQDKMVFLGGARQVGKTTLAQKLITQKYPNFKYFNWDRRDDRKQILNTTYPADTDLLIFDEIHKYKGWKTLIKGEYDTYKDRYKFIVTGSARLNIYRKGGDSLQGRYHYYTLHPFSLAEITGAKSTYTPFSELSFSDAINKTEFEALDTFGGFPEVLIKQNARFLRRWHNERNERLFREDIRDLENVRDVRTMQLLSDLLQQKVGSLLSINSLREDLAVSHRAVKSWLDILESFYYHFRIYPFHAQEIRSLKKEPKIYLFDWSEVENEPARFENLIASHLLKFVHFLKENQGYKAELNFLRNVDKKEVDFLISINKKPWFCVEAKLNESNISPALFYFKERLNIPFCFQVIKTPGIDLLKKEIRLISADKFLSALI